MVVENFANVTIGRFKNYSFGNQKNIAVKKGKKIWKIEEKKQKKNI